MLTLRSRKTVSARHKRPLAAGGTRRTGPKPESVRQDTVEDSYFLLGCVIVTFFRMDFPPFEIVYLKSAKSPVHAEPKHDHSGIPVVLNTFTKISSLHNTGNNLHSDTPAKITDT